MDDDRKLEAFEDMLRVAIIVAIAASLLVGVIGFLLL